MNKKYSKSKPFWCIVLPSAAILAGQFFQHLLTKIWPITEALNIGGISSYISILVSAILCFLIGRWLHHHINLKWGMALSMFIPVLWFGLMMFDIVKLQDRLLINGLTVTIFIAGILPLAAIILGWMTSMSTLPNSI
ncbi:MAG TPA: hypothetical protein VKA34_13085 [Balneolales bacterium]|nr:hypothetical protein [Balneolales bacterium]